MRNRLLFEGDKLAKLLIVFSSGLTADLEKRPGRNKLEKQEASIPRSALMRTLNRLSREMEYEGGTSHLRADIFDEPIHIKRLYKPKSLSILLGNFRGLLQVPSGSQFETGHPNGYIANFSFGSIGWSVLTAYLEIDGEPVLVCLNASEDDEMAATFNKLSGNEAGFDELFGRAFEVAKDALDS